MRAAFCRRWRAILDIEAIIGVVALVWPPQFQSDSGQCSLRTALFAYLARIFFSDDLMRSVLRWRFLVFIGGISYSFSVLNGLLHGIILGQVPKLETFSGLLVAAAVLLTAGLLAILSKYYFEMPIRRFARRLKYQSARNKVAMPAQAALPQN